AGGRRADLLAASARLLAVQHAQPQPQPLLPAGAVDREGGGLERRPLLGRAARAVAAGARRAPGHRAVAGEEHRAAAQLRGRADAVRAHDPGRRRRAHRAADRRQGSQPRRVRRVRGLEAARPRLRRRPRRAAALLAAVPGPDLEGAALLVVADQPAARLPGHADVRPSRPRGGTVLPALERGRPPQHRRELRRVAVPRDRLKARRYSQNAGCPSRWSRPGSSAAGSPERISATIERWAWVLGRCALVASITRTTTPGGAMERVR